MVVDEEELVSEKLDYELFFIEGEIRTCQEDTREECPGTPSFTGFALTYTGRHGQRDP